MVRFRRIVQGHSGKGGLGFASLANGISGELQLVTDHQNVRRLHLAVHEVFTVEKTQSVECRRKHFPRFIGSQSTLRQELSQSLFSVFHYDEQKSATAELAMT